MKFVRFVAVRALAGINGAFGISPRNYLPPMNLQMIHDGAIKWLFHAGRQMLPSRAQLVLVRFRQRHRSVSRHRTSNTCQNATRMFIC